MCNGDGVMGFFSKIVLFMSFIISIISFTVCAVENRIDGLYVNTFGSSLNPAIIFVHGGPGYNSHDFEVSTADKLAKSGYFVIVYDQRGQGRSNVAISPQDYTYRKYADDILSLILKMKLRNVTLIGHSHGGPISIQFARFYPGVVEKIILVSAPVNFWATMKSIVINCLPRLQNQNKFDEIFKLNLNFEKLSDLNQPFVNQVSYNNGLFTEAMGCGLYKTKIETSDATKLRAELEIDKKKFEVSRNNMFLPMGNFLVNENYIRLDYSSSVQNNSARIFGIYGDEDGLFTQQILEEIKTSLKGNQNPYNFQLIKGSSHSVYIDQNQKFIEAVLNILKY